MTKIYTEETIAQAANAIRSGKLVAFPTETVYGLGAIANNSDAIREVFQVKGRPQDNPLIVHVDSINTVSQFVHVTPLAQKLMDSFWPGPLTIIFPYEGNDFSPLISAGQPTISMRMPDHSLTCLLIQAVGFPIVGPSANKSGKPSPTNYQHVLHDFDGEIDGVIRDSQSLTRIGVESTVIYPQTDRILVLRPGAITCSQLESVADVPVIELTPQQQLTQNVMSPGVKYTHYSPSQPVYLLSFNTSDAGLLNWYQVHAQEKIGLIADDDVIERLKALIKWDAVYSFGPRNDVSSAMQRLYDGLRWMDDQPVDCIVVQGFDPQANETHALMNRLSKASDYVI